MKTTPLILIIITVTLTLGAGSALARANSFDSSHSLLTEVLERHVGGGGNEVDYAGLQADPAPLERYLNQLAAIPKSEFDRWLTNDRLAFLINRYNSCGGQPNSIMLNKQSDHHILPHPAVFVADTNGKIRFADVNPDYRTRLEPARILEAAKEAGGAAEGSARKP